MVIKKKLSTLFLNTILEMERSSHKDPSKKITRQNCIRPESYPSLESIFPKCVKIQNTKPPQCGG